MPICTCSTKLVKEVQELIIPLIQKNQWRQAKKPEELEAADGINADDSASRQVVRVAQTGDADTDLAIKELLTGKKLYALCIISIESIDLSTVSKDVKDGFI